ncbi:MAG: thioredoxin family protein [Mollicutes bacterium]|nr:thioredoxin family protein [Mollicutes bacterium]
MNKKLLVISALWCPSCLLLKKQLKRLKEEYPLLEIHEYDYDFDEEVVGKYDVGKILPVLIYIKDNKEEKRIVGEKDYQDIINMLGE